MNYEYKKVEVPKAGLRLHLNENTGGCSTTVLAALRDLTCEDVAYYPDYSDAIAACADYLQVEPDRLLLTNGLDEGILAASVAALRGATSKPYEAIVVPPCFDMYAACADAAGGRVVEVPQRAGFEFPDEEILAALSPQTRLIFITDPNNPTGLSVRRDSILNIAREARSALVFVDEAYADFRGTSLIGDGALTSLPNIVIGRTFAKAQGLAAIRIGALVGAPETLSPIRGVVPPYSINVAAAVALPAALRDRRHIEDYLEQSRESKGLLYATFERVGVPYWRSDANFVLARFGARADHVVSHLSARGIHVRDRGLDAGCDGCVRITAGVVIHTRQAIEAIEEVMCGER